MSKPPFVNAQALADASGHTLAEAEIIVRKLNENGYFVGQLLPAQVRPPFVFDDEAEQ